MKILVLEDSFFQRQALVSLLEPRHLVQATYSPDKAMNWLNQENFDYCLVGLFLGNHSGLEFIYETATWPDLAQLNFIIVSVDPVYLRQPQWGLTDFKCAGDSPPNGSQSSTFTTFAIELRV